MDVRLIVDGYRRRHDLRIIHRLEVYGHLTGIRNAVVDGVIRGYLYILGIGITVLGRNLLHLVGISGILCFYPLADGGIVTAVLRDSL